MSNSLLDPPSFEPRVGARVIESDVLAVELMDPASPERYNRGVRFTPLAAAIRAVAHGHDYLFHLDRPDPLTDVAGLFAEFDLVTPPPGFVSAALGEPFVKIGVGALRKTHGEYRFSGQYPAVRLAETETRWASDRAVFRQVLAPVRGIGYELEATVSVAGCVLSFEWRLANRGDEPFATSHYLHNSFTFDTHPVGPGYVVSLPFVPQPTGMTAETMQLDREIHFVATLPKPANIAIAIPEGTPNQLVVSHPEAGMRVRVESSLPGERLALHAASHYVCPEQFCRTELAPGEAAGWTRSYAFELA